ncbi:hypothetical protein RB195_002290 [Necator americanus]|uniref:Uncharacterized protein n=1 Tax=Necator americanus TaxID=51031 RepID=A0ABR1DJD0_NECAM
MPLSAVQPEERSVYVTLQNSPFVYSLIYLFNPSLLPPGKRQKIPYEAFLDNLIYKQKFDLKKRQEWRNVTKDERHGNITIREVWNLATGFHDVRSRSDCCSLISTGTNFCPASF